MEYLELVGALAVLQFVFFGFLTGQARKRSGLKAPAVTGDVGFERIYRVQMNTLETLVAFLPGLFIAGQYWSPVWVACIGVIYLVGRLIYWRAYMNNPDSRAFGFILSLSPTLVLVILAVIGPFVHILNS